jgi:CubicO group peptidase (beta-lactamase class C family)
MKFKWLFAVAVAAVAAVCQSGELRDSGTHYAADAVMPYIESGELPGAISVFYKDGAQETACLGWADVDKKIPMSLDRTFMQCSQTKGFCGVTVAILLEEGKISLDDPVSKYLPEFAELKVAVKDKDGNKTVVPAKNVLTIRMVMNHMGGFPFEIPSKCEKGWSSCSLRDSAREGAANPLLFEPGTKAKYSNTGIDIGAAVVEVVTGKPWEIFLKERVLDPLGMKDTTFQPTDEQLSRAISMYDVKAGEKAKYRAFNKWMPLPHNGPTVFPSAGAGLWTTTADQLKFYKMLMNLGVGENGARILKEDTVRKYLAASTRPAKYPDEYSLGLWVDSERCTMGHGGAWKTKCEVNWRKKELKLWVVQQNGKPGAWRKAWDKAAEKFFDTKEDGSKGDAYTGRLK